MCLQKIVAQLFRVILLDKNMTAVTIRVSLHFVNGRRCISPENPIHGLLIIPTWSFRRQILFKGLTFGLEIQTSSWFPWLSFVDDLEVVIWKSIVRSLFVVAERWMILWIPLRVILLCNDKQVISSCVFSLVWVYWVCLVWLTRCQLFKVLGSTGRFQTSLIDTIWHSLRLPPVGIILVRGICLCIEFFEFDDQTFFELFDFECIVTAVIMF